MLNRPRPPARQAASSSYFPIIVTINIGYLFLRLIYQRSLISVSHLLATIVLVALSFVSYKGILEDHANTIPKGKGGNSSEALAGGASLDLLGLVVMVQFGSALISNKFYWLLLAIPIWGMWKLYSIFYGSTGGGMLGGLFPKGQQRMINNEDATLNDDQNKNNADKSMAKRQRRAEKRQQKWS